MRRQLAQHFAGARQLHDPRGAVRVTGELDLRKDVQLLAGRPTVTQAAVAFSSGDEDPVKLARLKEDLAGLFREFLAQNPSYMQVRYLAKDADGNEKVRLDRSEHAGAPFQIPKEKLQGKRGNAYFDQTITLSPGLVYRSEININKENGKRQWGLPVIRAAVPVFAPNGSECLGIVVINMEFESVLNKLHQAATADLHLYLTDREGRFLAFPDHEDIAFSSYRGLDFNLEMLFDDVKNFRSRQKKFISELKATPHQMLLISSKQRGKSSELILNLEESLGDSLDSLEILKTEYDKPDSFVADDADADKNDARPMAVLSGDDWSPGSVESQLKDTLPGKFEVTQLPNLDPSSDHALYCRKIFFDPGNPERYLCLLLVLPHTTSLEAEGE